MTTEGTHRVMDNLTGQPVRGGLSEDAATWLCRGLNLRDGPGGRYSVMPADPDALLRLLRTAAAELAAQAPWQWQAVRGRIILGLVSAGPEYVISPDGTP